MVAADRCSIHVSLLNNHLVFFSIAIYLIHKMIIPGLIIEDHNFSQNITAFSCIIDQFQCFF